LIDIFLLDLLFLSAVPNQADFSDPIIMPWLTVCSPVIIRVSAPLIKYLDSLEIIQSLHHNKE
jgi:hypothetical protein